MNLDEEMKSIAQMGVRMYFAVRKYYFKQCGNSCFSDVVWRKQLMAGDAGGRNSGIVHQYPVFTAEPEIREDGKNLFNAEKLKNSHCIFMGYRIY